MSIDWNAVTGALSESLKEPLAELVDGAKEDLSNYGIQIAKDMVRAVRSGDEEIKDELIAQSYALLEINRIRVNRAAAEQVRTVLRQTLLTATKLAIAGVLA